MVSNLTFNWQLLSTPVLLDGISDSEFTFNDIVGCKFFDKIWLKYKDANL